MLGEDVHLKGGPRGERGAAKARDVRLGAVLSGGKASSGRAKGQSDVHREAWSLGGSEFLGELEGSEPRHWASGMRTSRLFLRAGGFGLKLRDAHQQVVSRRRGSGVRFPRMRAFG